jgi:hypothetical protein
VLEGILWVLRTGARCGRICRSDIPAHRPAGGG